MGITIRAATFIALVASIAGCGGSSPATQSGLDPGAVNSGLTTGINYVGGNPTCADLFGANSIEYKIDPPQSGTFSLDGYNSVTVTISGDNKYFDWTSEIGIDAVIAKGGPAANVYVYDPEAFSGTGLHSPNLDTGQIPELSHISFCFDYELGVAKTADTSFKRAYSWSITKGSDATSLTLATGETYKMNYSVTVTMSGTTDSDWAVKGKITIKNPAPPNPSYTATITSVTDSLPGSTVSVDCGVTFPYTLVGQGTLECTYDASLAGANNGTNTATVTTTGLVGGGSGTASVDFSKATIAETDECVDVSDDKYGSLGKVCQADAPKTFNYSMNIGPYATCGDYTYVNTASFKTNDTSTTGEAQVTVSINVPCSCGCTLTPGYWKTHSSYGPAPYDDAWALLGSGADTSFFLSGQSYYQVFWTAPGGNAYYILAAQYIAAQLNNLNGADFDGAQTAFDAATALFVQYTPAQIGALKGNSALRAQFIALANTLASYNTGTIGPGHCSESF